MYMVTQSICDLVPKSWDYVARPLFSEVTANLSNFGVKIKKWLDHIGPL